MRNDFTETEVTARKFLRDASSEFIALGISGPVQDREKYAKLSSDIETFLLVSGRARTADPVHVRYLAFVVSEDQADGIEDMVLCLDVNTASDWLRGRRGGAVRIQVDDSATTEISKLLDLWRHFKQAYLDTSKNMTTAIVDIRKTMDLVVSVLPLTARSSVRKQMDAIGTGDTSPVQRRTTMDFGEALRALQEGKKVARAGWNGKNMFLVYVPGTPQVEFKENSPYQKAGVVQADINPHIDMMTADGKFQPGWLASQTDMLAKDWTIV